MPVVGTTWATERWQDASGVVHVVAMLPVALGSGQEWRTYCRIIPVVSVGEIETSAHYTQDPPTCLQCVVRARR